MLKFPNEVLEDARKKAEELEKFNITTTEKVNNNIWWMKYFLLDEWNGNRAIWEFRSRNRILFKKKQFKLKRVGEYDDQWI